ncbi:sulfatase [Tautonia sociabilis]|nr:sulfatase [Tautonia sociabilis]
MRSIRSLATFWTLLGLSAAHPASAAEPGRPASRDRPPNVVLILADDLGWSDLACFGADLHETPRIDAMAREGVRFTSAYAAPVCSPTRAALLTGTHPARLHMTVWYEQARRSQRDRPLIPPATVADLPHSERTLAEALRDAGYLTAHVGKWHLGAASHYPETQGFDVNVGGTFWGAPPTFFFPYRGLWSNSDEYRYVPDLEWGAPGEYLTDRLTDEALRIIARAGDRPVYLNLWYHAVHTPIEARPEVVDRYRARLSAEHRHRNPTYAAMVDILDHNVGRLLDGLERLGTLDETILIFLSDNGGYINEYRGEVVTSNAPLRSGKGSLYEGGIRVPLIVRSPEGAGAGTVVEEPVTVMDLFPTILDLAGVPDDPVRADRGDGRSLAPLLDGPSDTAWDGHDALFWHFPHYYPTTTPVGAIRSGDWKLLEYFEDGRVELYDLASDPSERHDRAEDCPDLVASLRRRLRDWRREVDAQMPEPNPAFARSPE